MKKGRIQLLSVLMFVFMSAAVSAQDDAEIKNELQLQYQKLADAHNRKDFQAIAGLKTSDFHAIFPDGKVGDVKQMQAYTKRFIESNLPPYNIRNTIQKLSVSENKLVAVVEVLQEASRSRQFPDKVRKLDTSVLQRETWVKTVDGWKLKLVDNVRDGKTFIDGKRIDPSKPYDPDAPAFNPEEKLNSPQ